MKFVRTRAADRAGIGRHSAEAQAETREDAAVGVIHDAVFALQVFEAGVERVAVLHEEFTTAHHAETWADLVAELGLDLIQMNRQLAVALDFLAHKVGDHFFVRRADDEIALVAILETQQFGTVLLATARFLPELKGLHGRHQHFQGAGAVHFVAHDRFNLAQGAQAQRCPGVDARGQAADQPGAQHQLLADDFGVGRGFFERGN